MSKCGKCGGEGHNARSCGKTPPPGLDSQTTGNGGKLVMKKAKKTRKAVVARSTSVSEALVERRDALKKELETVERVLTDIEALGL